MTLFPKMYLVFPTSYMLNPPMSHNKELSKPHPTRHCQPTRVTWEPALDCYQLQPWCGVYNTGYKWESGSPTSIQSRQSYTQRQPLNDTAVSCGQPKALVSVTSCHLGLDQPRQWTDMNDSTWLSTLSHTSSPQGVCGPAFFHTKDNTPGLTNALRVPITTLEKPINDQRFLCKYQ